MFLGHVVSPWESIYVLLSMLTYASDIIEQDFLPSAWFVSMASQI